jgi:hypothetical protein
MKLQTDGAILIGGNFTTVSTQPRGRIARLSTPPPALLSIRRDNGTNVVVSWPAAATGFTLESKGDLNSAAWNTVFPYPVISGTNYVATNEVTGQARFYRLRQ